MSAPTEVTGVDVRALMKLVRAYGRACTRDGARCAGVSQPGHGRDVIEARIAVERALNAALARVEGRS